MRGTRCDDKRDIASNPSRCCGPTLHFGAEPPRGLYRQIRHLERSQRLALRFYSSATVFPDPSTCPWVDTQDPGGHAGYGLVVHQISQSPQPILKTSRGFLQFTSGMQVGYRSVPSHQLWRKKILGTESMSDRAQQVSHNAFDC